MDLKATTVFSRHMDAMNDDRYRFIVHQGGTRSSKTYSIAQDSSLELLKKDGNTRDIVRKTMPSLRQTSMKDVFEILNNMGIYSDKNHNKTESIYSFNGNEICFFGVDDEQKVRGRKRDVLWLNEANEIPYDVFQQLNFRTSGKIILDYNPSDEFHWIYERILGREDCKFIKSTYKDNPFLPEQQIKEIERLKETDPNYWRVYGLGERGSSKKTIFPKWDIVDSFPGEDSSSVYGMDFGYNAPSAILKVKFIDEEWYIQERLYERGLTNTELIENSHNVVDNNQDYLYADSAEPDRVQEFEDAGFNVHFCDKKSVKIGIDFLKRFPIHIVETDEYPCENLKKEVRNYKWKEDRKGNVLDEPNDINDHLMACFRYGGYTHYKHLQIGFW